MPSEKMIKFFMEADARPLKTFSVIVLIFSIIGVCFFLQAYFQGLRPLNRTHLISILNAFSLVSATMAGLIGILLGSLISSLLPLLRGQLGVSPLAAMDVDRVYITRSLKAMYFAIACCIFSVVLSHIYATSIVVGGQIDLPAFILFIITAVIVLPSFITTAIILMVVGLGHLHRVMFRVI